MNMSEVMFAAGRRPVRSTLQRGFAIVSAIFLLVVLAGLGVAMVTFSTSQHVSSGLDVLGSRAYQAARAGAEWALYQRLNPQVGAPGTNPAYCLTASAAGTTVTNSFVLPAGTTLSPFTVTVTCAAYSYPTISNVVRRITATACNGPSGAACPAATPGIDYVARTVQVSIQEKW